MQEFWTKQAIQYGKANDLEEKQRLILADFLAGKEGDLLELACGNGKVIADIRTKNTSLRIMGIDYNPDMIEVAKSRIQDVVFLEGDILKLDTLIGGREFDYIVCLNSLHNLPNKQLIFQFLDTMKRYTKRWGYIIFDIRNHYNPGVAYWYAKNRKRWLDFYTLVPQRVKKLFSFDSELVLDLWITYSNLAETGVKNPTFLQKIMYKIYFFIIQFRFFAPYRFLIFRKK